MPELTQQAGRIWMSALAEHLASVLTPLLPPDRELVATGTELAVMIRREGAPLKVALTFRLPTPGEAPVLDAETVDEVLRDLQDEIVLHLGETWPTAPDGRVLRATAWETNAAVGLGFELTSGDPAKALELDVFVPPGVGGPRVAG